MTTTGKDLALDKMGFTDLGQVLRNLPVEAIIENIVNHQEGTLGLNGAVMVDTGRYTDVPQKISISLMKNHPIKIYGGGPLMPK